MSKELIYAIKKAAGTIRQESVSYYQCEVLAQEDGTAYDSDEYTITVLVLTNKSSSSVLYDPNEVNPTNTNSDPNKMLGNTILTNVQLMASVDDGILYVPSIGSMVTVMVGTNQIPYVSQFSSIDMVQMDLINEYVLDVGVEDNTSEFYISGGTASIIVLNGDKSGKLTITPEEIDLNIEENSNLNLKDKITLTSKDSSIIALSDKISLTSKNSCVQTMDTGVKITTQGNAEISAETLIVLKNSVASLKSLFTGLVTALNTGANGSGPVVFSGDPGFVTLLTKINGLLG